MLISALYQLFLRDLGNESPFSQSIEADLSLLGRQSRCVAGAREFGVFDCERIVAQSGPDAQIPMGDRLSEPGKLSWKLASGINTATEGHLRRLLCQSELSSLNLVPNCIAIWQYNRIT